jgi:hypothetical protein
MANINISEIIKYWEKYWTEWFSEKVNKLIKNQLKYKVAELLKEDNRKKASENLEYILR